MKKMISFILVMCFVLLGMERVFASPMQGYYTREDGTVYYDIENYNRNIEKEQNMVSTYATRTAAPFVSITRYPQITAYHCGPASAYSVLDSLGITVTATTRQLYFHASCVNATSCSHGCPKNYTSPQVTLGTAMGTTYSSGTDIDRIRSTMNSYIGNNYYADYHITNNQAGITDFKNKVSSTLEDGHPVIIWVDARELDRYRGTDLFRGHYVCIYSINLNTNTVGICDGNYDSDYGGKYTATVADVVDAMHRSNGANNLIW